MRLLLILTGCVLSHQSCPPNSDFLPDPEDCAAFFQCTNGEKHRIICPQGLVFNTLAKYCDWPDNVNCDAKPQVSTTTTTSTSQSVTSTEVTSSSSVPSSSTTEDFASSSSPVTTNPPVSSSDLSSSCLISSSEPLSDEVRELRKSTCMLDNTEVEEVTPGRSMNPANVLIVENILSESLFKASFPNANPAYTYVNFLKAVAKFPALCVEEKVCRKILANMFAHFQQETAGLVYLREINKSNYCATWSPWVSKAYPCSPGKQYYGRGSKQLSWNYNYGAFSAAMFGDPSVLLQDPERVADTWLNFASAIWFFVTPQPPKPSMLHLVDGTWTPNSADLASGLKPGLGATTMAINGAIECGPSPGNSNASPNRQKYYKKFAKYFKVNISGEKLDCRSMSQFSARGSANPYVYWAPEQGCRLVRWQTAFSALVEGQHEKCLSSVSNRAIYVLYNIIHVFSNLF